MEFNTEPELAQPEPTGPTPSDVAKALQGGTGQGRPASTDPNPPDAQHFLALVRRLRAEGDRHATEQRSNRAMNRRFYSGDQWIAWDRRYGRILGMPPRPVRGEVEPVTLNVYQPAIDTAVARVAGAQPVAVVDPGSTDQQHIDAAQGAEQWLMGHVWQQLKMPSLLLETYKALYLDADTYWLVGWDPDAGPEIGDEEEYQQVGDDGAPMFEEREIPEEPAVGEDGMPLLDDDGQPVMQGGGMEQVPLMGMRRRRTGMPTIRLVLADDVGYDRTAVDLRRDAGWAYVKSRPSQQWVYDTYGIDVSPSRPAETTGVDWRKKTWEQDDLGVDVTTVYFRPGTYPYGPGPNDVIPLKRGYIVVATPDVLLHAGEADLDEIPIPLIHLRCLVKPGVYEGDTPATPLRSAQAWLNTLLTQFGAAVKYAAMPQILWPSSCDIPNADWTTMPAGQIRYKDRPGGGSKPEPFPGQGPAYSLTQLIQFIQNDYIPQLMAQHVGGVAGGAPGSVEAAQAFAQLESVDLARLGPLALMMVEALDTMGNDFLALARQYLRAEAALTVLGKSQRPQALTFTGSKISQTFRVRFAQDSLVPQNRVVKQRETFEMLDRGLINPNDARQRLGHNPGDEPTLLDVEMLKAADDCYRIRNGGTLDIPSEVIQRQNQTVFIEALMKLLNDPGFTPQSHPTQYQEAVKILMARWAVVEAQQLRAAAMSAGQQPGTAPPAATGVGDNAAG